MAMAGLMGSQLGLGGLEAAPCRLDSKNRVVASSVFLRVKPYLSVCISNSLVLRLALSLSRPGFRAFGLRDHPRTNAAQQVTALGKATPNRLLRDINASTVKVPRRAREEVYLPRAAYPRFGDSAQACHQYHPGALPNTAAAAGGHPAASTLPSARGGVSSSSPGCRMPAPSAAAKGDPVASPHPRPSEPETIDVISVDVDPKPEKKKKKKKEKRHHTRRERSRSSSRSSHSHEVYVERERIVPMPVPVVVRREPEYETFRYVEAAPPRPMRYLPAPPSPPRSRSRSRDSDERLRVSIHDQHRRREYYP
ncbi:hypothetical protein MAPG_04103 [Magnaporthiopsis poae ATCC 64411]|uniref:Uncharacterized protein n=1 Tax=Magnaporthiopsis poae (strain ATCC 64411 / 73-15) TaxID=644358 RepID=A0A0C4DVU0_MAGP6|nr:hypothetical protein MAPG_04103 [Magnaporthiopsis poae ATCC 64411]